MGRFTLSFTDYDRERSAVSVNVGDITSGVFDALVTSTNALQSAIEGVSLGLATSKQLSTKELLAAPDEAPDDKTDQREAKWLVRAYDAVTFASMTFEIPCADLGLLQENSKRMDISAGAGLTLKNAIEDTVKSPNGNDVVVVEVVHVGRNN